METAVRKLLINLLCRGQVTFLVRLNQRTNDIGLASAFNLFAHKSIDLVTCTLIPQKGADGLSSGRQVFNARNIEVTVNGECHRPWDWRCRHHEYVGHDFSLSFKGCTL